LRKLFAAEHAPRSRRRRSRRLFVALPFARLRGFAKQTVPRLRQQPRNNFCGSIAALAETPAPRRRNDLLQATRHRIQIYGARPRIILMPPRQREKPAWVKKLPARERIEKAKPKWRECSVIFSTYWSCMQTTVTSFTLQFCLPKYRPPTQQAHSGCFNE